jgi:hypothetical protein
VDEEAKQSEDEGEEVTVTADPAPEAALLTETPPPTAHPAPQAALLTETPPPQTDAAKFTRSVPTEASTAQLRIMDSLEAIAEAASYAAAYETAMLHPVPVLAGPVLGFGMDLESCPDHLLSGKSMAGKLKNSDRAPPSNERLFATGLGDAGYYGSADCFMTSMNGINERRIHSSAGLIRFDRYDRRLPEIGGGGEAGEEGEAEGQKTDDVSTEFLRLDIKCGLDGLGRDVAELTCESSRVAGSRLVPSLSGDVRDVAALRDARGRSLMDLAWAVLPSSHYSMYSFAYGFGPLGNDDVPSMEHTLANSYMDNCCMATSGDMDGDVMAWSTGFDSRMMCDYVPALRSISCSEEVNEQLEEALKNDATTAEGPSHGRRMLRRNRKRRHHFDEVANNNEGRGKETGEGFLKLVLKQNT